MGNDDKFSRDWNGAETLFDSSVPKVVQRGLIENVILESYAEAERKVEGFHPAIQHDKYMGYVHDEVQNRLLNLIGTFPEHLTVFPKPNSTSSSHHAELHCGSLILTASQTRLKGCLPADAKFRSAYAANLNTMLFELENLPAGQFTYAIIGHGRDRNDPIKNKPSWVDILFPDEASLSVMSRIPLLDRYMAGAFNEAVVEIEDFDKRIVKRKKSIKLPQRKKRSGEK